MDSELQIALIGAGIAAVVLVVGYNKWQERRHRRNLQNLYFHNKSKMLQNQKK